MKKLNPTIIALLYGPDRPGLVARVSSWIFENGGNIIHADQHCDGEEKTFFQRVEWLPPESKSSAHAAAFRRIVVEELGMNIRVSHSTDRPRVALMVSKTDHCFHDLVLRWQAGEFSCDISCVLSNHPDLQEAATNYGLPYFCIPVTPETRPQAEAEQIKVLKDYGAELIILGRYMQVLSVDFLKAVNMPIINIHHSFLPAFIGKNPYKQAHKRGVKLIGATAHYVTTELDQGPIIQQDVSRVGHRQNVRDLILLGRDLEKQVLAQAVRWHLESRILVYSNKTVVFD